MLVYEISEKGGRIPSESRTGKPRKISYVFCFQNPSFFIPLKEGDCKIIVLSWSCSVHQGISRPTKFLIYLIFLIFDFIKEA